MVSFANGCTVLGAIMLHHFIKAFGHLNGMLMVHLVATLATSVLWFNAKTYNMLAVFTMVFSISAGSLVPMYPLGQLDKSDKESWLLGGTQIIKWMVLTTAVAIPIIKVIYIDWASAYLSTLWMKTAVGVATVGYSSATVGLAALRFSMSPHLQARL
ncbi:hypothetical protein IWW55_002357 [Coemansia sp. RSA 2706]|nr:hypothetical protein IWW55_002357 [Coemansia sp. RSA 2706]